MGGTAREQISDVIDRTASEYLPGDFIEDWDLSGLLTQLEQIYPVAIAEEDLDPSPLNREDLIAELREDVVKAYDEREEEMGERAHARARALHPAPDHRRALAGAPARHGLPAGGHPPPRVRPDRSARGLQERGLRDVHRPDQHRSGRSSRATSSTSRSRSTRATTARAVAALGGGTSASTGSTRRVQLPPAAPRPTSPARSPPRAAGAVPEGIAGRRRVRRRRAGRAAGPRGAARAWPSENRVGRNDPCWCGSGKKYKKCHGA